MEENKVYTSKKIKTADGTIMYLWEGKLHNWEGVALIPQGNKKKGEYYIHGIKFTKDKFHEALKSKEGLPFFKQAAPKGITNRY